MTKSTRKKARKAILAKKAMKTAKGQTKAGEYVSSLLELHKWQGTLLTRLDKEIK